MGRALQRFVDDMEKDLLAKGLSKADAKAQAIRDVGRIWGKKTSAFRLDKGTVDASSKNIREQLEDMNLDLKDASLDDLVFYAPSRIKLQDNQFIFSKNTGNSRELEMWEISNPFLAESMMAVGDRIVRTPYKLLNFARGFKTLLTRGVTYDPGFFAYANLIRDSLSSSILSRDGFFGIGGGTIPILSTLKGYARQWTPNSVVMGKNGKSLKNFDGSDMTYRDLWSEFTLNGGGFDSTLMRSNLQESRLKSIYEKMGLDYKFVINRSKFMQGAPVKGVKKAINGVDDAVGMFEYASRFAEYHRLRSRGVGAREASYQAREIATDFAMHGSGSVMHFFTQTVPFLNAGLQGLYRTLRAGEGLSGSQRAYMAAKISTAILLPTFFFRWINRDNPEYKKLTQHTRDMHWIIPKEGGGHFLIPKPFEWGALSTLVDRAWDTWGDEEIINPLTNERIRWMESDKYFTGADFAEVATKVMSEQMRLNIMPQVFVPYSSLATNTRFTGSPIIPSFMRSYLPETEQAYPWSNAAILSAFRKYPEWAQWTGLSPIAIEHILKTYTGTVGAFAMDFIVDPAFREDGIDLGTGIPAKPEIDIPVFGTWDEVPLVKRFFLGDTPRHTKALIESYKLKNEVTKRMNELNKLEKEGLFDEYMKRINKPEWQDIIALDKGLSGQFAKMEQLSQAEKQLFQKGFPGTAKERGRNLEDIRRQKIQLTEELINMLEGYNLDYIIPREITLPFSGSRYQLPKYPKGQGISIGGAITTSPSQTFSGSLNELLGN